MVPGIAIKSMILFAQSPPPFFSRITHHASRITSHVCFLFHAQ